jgi:anti-sigma B factor antagonist
MLNISKKSEGTDLTVTLEGRLDTSTAPELEGALKDDLESVTSLVFDLKEMQYISSAGLRVLLSAQKVMNKRGSMVIKNASEQIMEIFDVTGFSEILTIE